MAPDSRAVHLRSRADLADPDYRCCVPIGSPGQDYLGGAEGVRLACVHEDARRDACRIQSVHAKSTRFPGGWPKVARSVRSRCRTFARRNAEHCVQQLSKSLQDVRAAERGTLCPAVQRIVTQRSRQQIKAVGGDDPRMTPPLAPCPPQRWSYEVMWTAPARPGDARAHQRPSGRRKPPLGPAGRRTLRWALAAGQRHRLAVSRSVAMGCRAAIARQGKAVPRQRSRSN